MNARQGPSCSREKTLLCSLHPQVSSVSVNWRCMHSWRLRSKQEGNGPVASAGDMALKTANTTQNFVGPYPLALTECQNFVGPYPPAQEIAGG